MTDKQFKILKILMAKNTFLICAVILYTQYHCIWGTIFFFLYAIEFKNNEL